jgi:hypothetical protein
MPCEIMPLTIGTYEITAVLGKGGMAGGVPRTGHEAEA